jgi:transcriptional regulator with XRE-family HTH domain
MPEGKDSKRIVRDSSFGVRFTTLCDENPNVPPPNFGRLGWFKDQFEKRYDESISIETVRKWLCGEVKPKPERILMLAQLLDVDEGWLAFGVVPEMTKREQRELGASGNGAVMVVAGLIEMAGGQPAFPAEGDKRAATESIDLYAIIRGAQYAMHISIGRGEGDLLKFSIPSKFENVMQVGVVTVDDFSIRMIDISEEIIAERGNRRGGSIEVEMTQAECEEFVIKSLHARL